MAKNLGQSFHTYNVEEDHSYIGGLIIHDANFWQEALNDEVESNRT